MKTPQQVWEEAYPDRRKWEALEPETREEWERVVRVAQESLIAEIKRLNSFDGWMQMEYTKVQMKSIKEDYIPKQP